MTLGVAGLGTDAKGPHTPAPAPAPAPQRTGAGSLSWRATYPSPTRDQWPYAALVDEAVRNVVGGSINRLLEGIINMTITDAPPTAVGVPRISDRAPTFTAVTAQGEINFPADYSGKWFILTHAPGGSPGLARR